MSRLIQIEKEIIKMLALFLVAMLVSCFVSQYVSVVRVNGESMMPTLKDHELILLNRKEEVQRGNVIVFHMDSDGKAERELIKRVIALPGDIVSICGTQVKVNGKKLSEEYLLDGEWNENGKYDMLVKLGTDQYFVMGDNRNNSYDSRYFGPIDGHDILGKTWFS